MSIENTTLTAVDKMAQTYLLSLTSGLATHFNLFGYLNETEKELIRDTGLSSGDIQRFVEEYIKTNYIEQLTIGKLSAIIVMAIMSHLEV